MPVFNQEKFIVESVKSILDQTYKDFELLIINDGSTDNTKAVIQNNFNDKRIKLTDNQTNSGIIFSLNKGVKLSLGSRFIARMDGDDIASQNRFQVQVDFMNQNEDTGLIGSQIKFFGTGTRSRIINYPSGHKKIMSAFLCLNPFAHSTVLFRSSLIRENNFLYDSEFPRYEDYAMWISFIKKTRFANIEDVLLKYRRHPANVTNHAKKGLIDSFIVIQKLINLYLTKCEIELPDNDVKNLASMLAHKKTEASVNDAIETLKKIKHTFPEKEMDKHYLSKILYRCFLKCYPKVNYLNEAEILRKQLKLNIASAALVWKSLVLKNSFPE